MEVLWKIKLPKLTDNLNSFIKGTEFIINFSTKKTLYPDNFTSGFYQTFQEEIIPTLYKVLQTAEERDCFSINLYASMTRTSKSDLLPESVGLRAAQLRLWCSAVGVQNGATTLESG